MTRQKGTKISQLIAKGVRIACPESIEIGAEVDVDRISGDGVTIHAGSKIFGDATVILKGAIIGFEAPATVKNCQIGPEVELKGGFFEDAVFLANAKASDSPNGNRPISNPCTNNVSPMRTKNDPVRISSRLGIGCCKTAN